MRTTFFRALAVTAVLQFVITRSLAGQVIEEGRAERMWMMYPVNVLLNALACECTVLASDVAPVRDVVEHGRTGLLGEFFDVEGLAAQAIRVLRDPQQYRQLGLEGRALIEREYGLEKVVPQFVSLFEKVVTQNQKHNVSAV